MVFPIAGGTQDTSYEIENSLRFNDDDSPYLSRTPSTATNNDKLTFSFWAKRSTPSANHKILTRYSSVDNRFYIGWANNDKLYIYQKVGGTESFNLQTTRLFRDPSAWYHIVVAYDTTQSTEANRIKLYVNGTQETSFSNTSYPSQNLDLYYQTATSVVAYIGQYTSSQYYDGYFSDMHLIDGQQLDSSYFGETNDNGVWIPKKYTGTYGDEGFKLEFKQTGTGTNSSGMGADTSGNDNHWAPSNLAATDVTEDTPTNNFMTFNSLSNLSGPTLSEGNTQMAHDSSNDAAVFGTFGLSNGKWYWELKGIETDQSGVQKWTPGVIGSEDHTFYSNRDGGYAPKATALYLGNGNVYQNNSSVSSAYFTATQNDIIQIALDADNNKIYFGKNGTYGNSGDPTSGSTGTGAVSLTASHAPFIPHFGEGTGHEIKVQANFGNAPFSISSGNTDGKYGNFEYAPPSGYYALCTKRLAEFG